MGEGGDSSDPVGGVEIAKPSKAGAACNQRPLRGALDGGSGTRSPLHGGV